MRSMMPVTVLFCARMLSESSESERSPTVLEELHDGELRPGEVGALGELLRDAAALRVEVDDGLEDLVHLALEVGADGRRRGRRGRRHDRAALEYTVGEYLAYEISTVSTPPSTGYDCRVGTAVHAATDSRADDARARRGRVPRRTATRSRRSRGAKIPAAWPGRVLVERAFSASLEAIRADPDTRLWGDRLMINRDGDRAPRDREHHLPRAARRVRRRRGRLRRRGELAGQGRRDRRHARSRRVGARPAGRPRRHRDHAALAHRVDPRAREVRPRRASASRSTRRSARSCGSSGGPDGRPTAEARFVSLRRFYFFPKLRFSRFKPFRVRGRAFTDDRSTPHLRLFAVRGCARARRGRGDVPGARRRREAVREGRRRGRRAHRGGSPERGRRRGAAERLEDHDHHRQRNPRLPRASSAGVPHPRQLVPAHERRREAEGGAEALRGVAQVPHREVRLLRGLRQPEAEPASAEVLREVD